MLDHNINNNNNNNIINFASDEFLALVLLIRQIHQYYWLSW